MQLSAPDETTNKTKHQCAQTDSNLDQKYQITPWLINLAYPLASHIVLPFYFRSIEITGVENIPTSGPVIIAPTHRSRWDAIIVPYVTGRYTSGRDLHFMVSANEMKGLQGWFVKRLGGFPVDTEQPGISSFRSSVEILSAGQMLVIFPEGGIFRDRQIHPLKPGLARIAAQVESNQSDKVKVLPLSINYSQPIPQRGTRVYVSIGTPLEVADYQGSNRQKAKQLTQDLFEALKQLNSDSVNRGKLTEL